MENAGDSPFHFDPIDEMETDILPLINSEIDPPFQSSPQQGIKIPIKKSSIKAYQREIIPDPIASTIHQTSGLKLPIRKEVMKPYQRNIDVIQPLTVTNTYTDMISSIHKTIHKK